MNNDANMEADDDDQTGYCSRRKLDEQEMKNLHPHLLSKYLAYEAPPKKIKEYQMLTKRRIYERKKLEEMLNQPPADEEEMERQQNEKLLGHLKAAEARDRIRLGRLQYHADRTEEINHLVASQGSAATAVRLEALLPTKMDPRHFPDPLSRITRDRVERLLNDNRQTFVGRR